jgi:8-oxo-dGTP pyrophosphatase MutT (NUDIX family)
MGRVDPGETPEQAAAREVAEETGWCPGPLRELAIVQPASGIMDAAHHIYAADTASRTPTGEPQDSFEAARIEWVPLADVPGLIAKREIVSSSTITALLLCIHGNPPRAAADSR